MQRFLKVLLALFLIGVLVLVLAIGTLSLLINPNQFKGPLSAQASQLLGRPVVIHGDIHWSFMPRVSIKVQDVEIKNRPGFTGTFAQLKSATLDLEILPLLHKELAIHKVHVKQLDLHFMRKPDGTNNWQDISNRTPPKTSQVVTHNSLLPFIYTAASMDVENSNIFYQDYFKRQGIAVRGINFKGHGLNLTTLKQQSRSGQSPLFILRNLKFSGQLNIDNLQYNDLSARNLSLKISANHGKLNLNPITADVFEGQLHSNFAMDVTKNTPQFNFKHQLKNVQAGLVFNHFLKGKSFSLSGLMNVNANLSSSGNSTDQILQHLQGNTDFSLQNGILYGIDIMHQVRIAQSVFTKQSLPLSEDLNQTAFTNFSGTFDINHGVATTNDVKLQSPDFIVNAQGNTNLATQMLNFDVKVATQSRVIDPRALELQRVLGGAIPLKISGTLKNYKIYPDSKIILLASAKYYVQKEVTRQLEKNGNKNQLLNIGNQLKKLIS